MVGLGWGTGLFPPVANMKPATCAIPPFGKNGGMSASAAGVLGLTGDVIAAGAALAGLILVYLGHVAAGYAGFDAAAQRTVRGDDIAHQLHAAWGAIVD